MTGTVAVIGTGMVPFGRYPNRSLKTLAAPAVEEALKDAGTDPAEIDMAFVANAAAAVITGQVSIAGQVALSHVGIHGIPVYNIDNACAGSSSALNLAVMAIRAGAAKRVLVVGVEKLFSENRAKTYRALNGAADIDWAEQMGVDLDRESVFVNRVYPARIADYRAKFGLEAKTLAAIAVKNRNHAGRNPLAQYRKPITIDEVLAARVVVEPLTTLMCAPIGDGAAAAVVVGKDNAHAPGLRPAWILGSVVSMGAPPGRSGTTIRRVAEEAYREAGIGPDRIALAEVHDATAFSELMASEELGFCEPGQGVRMVERGDSSLGGRLPINPSGGLESRGHPIAATGLAQIVELVIQLRGEAGDRQVPNAHYALAETAGGYVAGDSAAVAVHILGTHPSTA